MSKNKSIEINSDDLFKISIKLLEDYNLEPNIHFILLLSYFTIKEFSKKNTFLDKYAKIELSIKYLPDLLSGLKQYYTIDIEITKDENELKEILEIYTLIFAYKNDDIYIKNKTCCF